MNRICIGIGVSLCIVIASSALAESKPPKDKAPPEATVFVDCSVGDRITDALETPAIALTIEISGICVEDVEIQRTNVTLRGTDPMIDGISSDPEGPMRQALTVRNVSMINVENLKLTGAYIGIGINDSFGVYLRNCRLEDNAFAGAIVGTASGSISFTDTVVTAPSATSPNRGIWATNGSSATCNDCTIRDYQDAFIASTGALMVVYGGSITATRFALQVVANSTSVVYDATLDGRILMFDSSAVTLSGVFQGSSVGSNVISNGSTLFARWGTTLSGDTWVNEFANVVLEDGSSISNDMTCRSGGDAYCDDPLAATTSSNCGQCANPPPP